MPAVEELSSRGLQGLDSTRSYRSKHVGGFDMDPKVTSAMDEFVRKDDDRDKTWSRIIVEKYLSNWKWYFPMKDKEGGPKLTHAYAFYEHVTLPRYFSAKQEADHMQRRAEPGEAQDETRLFSPFFTKATSYNQWGIGIDSYFSSLKMVACMLFIAGLLNWHNMSYFASNEYSAGQPGIATFEQGSAICTEYEWVVCPTCTEDQFDSTDDEKKKFGVANDGTGLALVQRNACGGDFLAPGMVNLATFFLLLICMIFMSLYLRAREIRSDEDKLTASDYSVVVRNPPPDAFDPDTWKDYFERFASEQVTCVTIAINNETMLRKLIARRIHRNNLRLVLPQGTNMDDENLVQTRIAELEREKDAEPKGCFSCLISTFVMPIFHTFNMFLPPQSLFDKVVKLTGEIQGLQKEEYQVSNVFVTFETEEGQRTALTALSAGVVDVITNNTSGNERTVFQDRVLRVEEPAEPSAVRWMDLSASFSRRLSWRLINLFITVGVVTLAGICVAAARANVGTVLSGPLVSIFNSIIPQVVKILMMFERHYTENSYQTSLYLKITLFRWVNTAALIKIITPFPSTITNGATDVIPSIIAIFWSELTVTPLLKLIDMYGNFKKHILAPRARTQEQMNSNFIGTFYNLGERNTDFSKVLFLVFFYAALFPAGFFFGAAILLIQHYSDKYMLMRVWAWTPSLGSELSKFSRRYFFFGALICYAIVSAFAWAQFPYDNVCDPNEPNGTDFSGVYTDVLVNGEIIPEINVTQTTEVTHCSQSRRDFSGMAFPPTSRLQPSGETWMTSSQEKLVDAYGWTALGILIAFFVIFFGSSSVRIFLNLFRSTYSPSGKDQKVDFSSNPEIFAYVPQIKLPSYPFPLLACNIDQVDKNLIGWTDDTRGYDYHNLMFDAMDEETSTRMQNTRRKLAVSRQENVVTDAGGVEVTADDKPIFSTIKHYPPPWLQKILENEDLEKEDKKEE